MTEKEDEKDPYLSELDSLEGFEDPAKVESKDVDIPLPGGLSEDLPNDKSKKASPAGAAAGTKKEKKSEPVSPGPGKPESGKAKKGIEDFASDIPLQVSAVLGSREISLYELATLKSGEVVELSGAPNQIIDLMVNGRVIARGELVEIDGKLGVRILKVT